MRNLWMFGGLLATGFAFVPSATASDLPAGPIHDRHELMEGIGKNAKALGGAVKAGDAETLGTAAANIQTAAAKIAALFPKGSTHPESRAKPEIWENWERFVELTKALEAAAASAVKVAGEGGNLGATTGPIFRTCKGCHDQFREPEEQDHSSHS